ncbi:hypothetical protein ACIHFE_19865 [Streptomyces sp. NPDC052396]|uniref:hypothetical protein n=1 Tax=Streptomyces sp. NPDC052396 TaxID=3365689 RepID=UPI0037D84E32
MKPEQAAPAAHLVPTVRRQHLIPEAIRALGIIAESDYLDLFTVTTSGVTSASPERWARAAIEEAQGLKAQFVWRVLLGLRLGWGTSPDHVGGWRIAERGPDWLRVQADSWLLTAHLVFHVDDRHTSVATVIHYNHPMASRLWPVMSMEHRRAMPGVLRGAHRVQAGR